MLVPLFHVNAFTAQPFAGNPAAVCGLNCWLDDQTLRKVASENNLSATAFLVSRDDHHELRWFTPRCEVRLCGHATLASAFVVLNILRPGREKVQFETEFSGKLEVRRDGERYVMDFPSLPARLCGRPTDALLRALRGPVPSAVREGNETFVVVYEAESAVRELSPDLARLELLHPFAVVVTAPGEEADFVSRYFAPSYGVPEDPVTGSAHSVLTPYWGERLGRTQLRARQLSQRGGELFCELRHEVAGDRVLLKGEAVLTLQGSLVI